MDIEKYIDECEVAENNYLDSKKQHDIVTKKYHDKKKAIENKYISILKYMGLAESSVIKKYQEKFNYTLKPCYIFGNTYHTSNVIHKFKKPIIKHNIVTLKYIMIYCYDDGSTTKSFKTHIPLKYFSYSLDEIIKNHKVWSEERLNIMLRGNKIDNLKNIIDGK